MNREFIIGIEGEMIDVTCFPPDTPGTVRHHVDYGDDYEDDRSEDDDENDWSEEDDEDQID